MAGEAIRIARVAEAFCSDNACGTAGDMASGDRRDERDDVEAGDVNLEEAVCDDADVPVADGEDQEWEATVAAERRRRKPPVSQSQCREVLDAMSRSLIEDMPMGSPDDDIVQAHRVLGRLVNDMLEATRNGDAGDGTTAAQRSQVEAADALRRMVPMAQGVKEKLNSGSVPSVR